MFEGADHTTIIIIVALVGTIAVLTTVGLLILGWKGVHPPESISGLAQTSIGALAGMLASTRVGRQSDRDRNGKNSK